MYLYTVDSSFDCKVTSAIIILKSRFPLDSHWELRFSNPKKNRKIWGKRPPPLVIRRLATGLSSVANWKKRLNVSSLSVCVHAVQPERGWEVDVEDIAAHVDDDTSCIVVNNPSNPCGSVYSRRHLLDILRVAERLRLPIIADEIYADFVSYASARSSSSLSAM